MVHVQRPPFKISMSNMASSGWYENHENVEDSAVIDLSDVVEPSPTNGLVDDTLREPTGDGFDDPNRKGRQDGEEEADLQKKLMDAMKSQVADTVWETGKQQAKKAFDLYANIDILRPYFDVEPKQVVSRLVFSFVPKKPTGSPQKVVTELYGPVMIVFTLVALLIMGMKDSGHVVREGTLMGSAIGICFGYWLIASGIFFTVAYITNTYITMIQVLSLTGYSMFSFCVILFYGTVMHSINSHALFYSVWSIFGGLSAAKMVCVYLSRTTGKSQRMLMIGTVVAIHLLFILYLHFAYHKIVQAPSVSHDSIIEERAAPELPNVLQDNEIIEKLPGGMEPIIDQKEYNIPKAGPNVLNILGGKIMAVGQAGAAEYAGDDKQVGPNMDETGEMVGPDKEANMKEADDEN